MAFAVLLCRQEMDVPSSVVFRCLVRTRFSLRYEVVAIDVRWVIYLTSNASDVGRFRPFPVSCLLAMVVNGSRTGGLALRVL